jgi:HYR domain
MVVRRRNGRRLRRAVAFVLGAAVAALVSISPAAATVPLPVGTIPVPTSGTFLYLNSDPLDWVGQGMEQLYTSADSSFSASLTGHGNAFGASLLGPGSHFWSVSVSAPSGEPLAVGSYEGAGRAPFVPPETPGLDVEGDGRGCNTLTGRFDVDEVERAISGDLLVFQATFEQHCEGSTAALYGRIRIENPPPAPDTTAPTLVVPDEITVEGLDDVGTIVTYGASATDDHDPDPTVQCNPEANTFFPVGTTTVTCRASDLVGNVATASFPVHVFPPLQLGASLASQGSVDARTGAATISGTVSCSRNISLVATVRLDQSLGKRAPLTGFSQVPVDCVAPATSWSATVAGQSRLQPGDATVSAFASGCEVVCHSASASSTVHLSVR